jgi:Holliday junction resolvasome RuvABC endonuclease subunit
LTRGALGETKIRRLLAIARQVVNVAKEFEVKNICIENYAFNARGAQNDLGELHGVIKTQLLLQDFSSEVISCTQARKLVLGKGRLKKNEIVRKLNEMGYTEVKDHNIADALVVALATRKKKDESN